MINSWRITSFFKFAACACVAILLALSLAPTSALAHKSDTKRLTDEINSISRQLEALQQRVLELRESSNPNDGVLLADMEIRLGALDRGFRNLTGQLEEINHRQARMEREFERFRSDMELRLQDMASQASGPSLQFEVVETPVENQEQVQPQLQAETPAQGVQAEPVEDEQSTKVELALNDPEGSYEQAFGFLRRGDYSSAEEAFNAFLSQYGDHELAGNAHYWLAETYYARRDYANAASAFLAGYQKYSDGNKAPDSLLKLGMSLSAMEQGAEACIVFEDLLVQHSQAPQNILDSALREIDRNSCR